MGVLDPKTYVRVLTKVFHVTQMPSTGNLWASLAEQLDAWLQTGNNTNILIRDLQVDRQESTRGGIEAVVLTILYEAGYSDGVIESPRGFGYKYRVLYIDSLIGTSYDTFNEWYEDQAIVNGLDDERRMQWIISMPAIRRGDIAKGSQFFALYAENDITPADRSGSRQLAAGRGDYLWPMIVESDADINNGSFGNLDLIAPDGTVIDATARGKNVFNTGAVSLAGSRSYAVNDLWHGGPMAIQLRANVC